MTTLRASYVVGCDGGHSSVRQALGVPFEGEDPTAHWLAGDARLDRPPEDGTAFGRNLEIGTYQVSQVEPAGSALASPPPPSSSGSDQ